MDRLKNYYDRVHSSLPAFRNYLSMMLFYQFVSSLFLLLLLYLFRYLMYAVIYSSGHAAITSGDLLFIFRSWRGYLLIFLGLILFFLIIAIMLNGQILIADSMLRSRRISFPAAFFSGMRSATLFFNFQSTGIILYILAATLMLGITFLFQFPGVFEPASFILYHIERTRIFLILYILIILFLVIIFQRYILLIPCAILEKIHPSTAIKRSRSLVKSSHPRVRRLLGLKISLACLGFFLMQRAVLVFLPTVLKGTVGMPGILARLIILILVYGAFFLLASTLLLVPPFIIFQVLHFYEHCLNVEKCQSARAEAAAETPAETFAKAAGALAETAAKTAARAPAETAAKAAAGAPAETSARAVAGAPAETAAKAAGENPGQNAAEAAVKNAAETSKGTAAETKAETKTKAPAGIFEKPFCYASSALQTLKKISPVRLGLSIFAAVVLFSLIFFDRLFPPTQDVSVISHRLGGDYDVENSVEGQKLLLEKGALAAETDVQRTKDGQYIIFHDSTTRRMCGVNKAVADLTLDEIRQLTISDKHGTGRRIPTFEEVLNQARGRQTLYIELKSTTANEESADDIIAMVRSREMQDQCMIISMNYNVISYIHKNYDDIRTGFLYFFAFGNEPLLNCDMLIVQEKSISSQLVRSVHTQGKTIGGWTVNSKKNARRLLRTGVDAIVTDRYEMVMEVIDYMGQRPDYQRVIDQIYN